MKVLVTGASRGIGLAIAKAFAAKQYDVAISSRSQEKLNQAKADILSKIDGARVQTFVCDASSKEAVLGLAEQIKSKWGGVDILVNNAGVYVPGSIGEADEGALETMLSTNLYSAYHITRALLPMMQEKQAGDVVNICSIASNTPYANGGAYSISKYAMYGFSKNLREEMKPHGVRVISVLPGGVFTDSWNGSGVDEMRIMPVEDIAELVVTACSLSRRSVVEDLIVRPQLGDL
ncbi:MAG: SDR family oxidoreductase [Saprospiraceae bacterium]|nr:SDR family oxidoreductase [Saprospiraceae bacterium]